jgi:hypothetical protein
VFDIQNVVEDVSDLGVPYPLFLYTHHVDGKNMSNASVQEDLKFVEQALPKQPRLTAPQEQINWDCSKKKIFAVGVEMWVPPDFFEGFHGCSSSCNLCCDISITAEVE